MSHEDLFEILEYTFTKLDSQVAALQAEYQNQMQCRKGCSGCCMDGFKIRYIEALNLLKGFVNASPEVAQAVMARLEDDSPEGKAKCPMLVDGACAVYENRPSLCRAYGLLIQLKEDVATCGLNFKNMPAGEPVKVLDIAPYYVLLDELSERLWQSRPNPLLVHGPDGEHDPPNLSIREFFQVFLNHQPLEKRALSTPEGVV